MCGRARCTLSREEVMAAACVGQDQAKSWRDEQKYHPSANVGPGHHVPVVKRSKDGNLEVHTMKWGLVPSFTKPGDKLDHFRMFNARSETVAEKGIFKRLLASMRCIVLVNGFYEWKKANDHNLLRRNAHQLLPAASGLHFGRQGSSPMQAMEGPGGGKQPYYVNWGDRLMPMAGLFDVWSAGEVSEPLYTFTILTTDSSKRLAWLHDRMPVVLPTQQARNAWLGTGDPASCNLGKLTMPYNDEDLVWHPVTKSINNISFQDLNAWKPVKQANIACFFSKAGSKSSSASKGSNPAEERTHQQHKASSVQDAAEPDPIAGQLKEESGPVKQETTHGDLAQLEAQAAPSDQAAPPASAILNTDDAGGVVESEADVKQEQQHEKNMQPPLQLSGKKRTSTAQTPGKGKKAKPAGTQSISNYFSPNKTS